MKEKNDLSWGILFYYDFGDNSGSVQSGERPVLVVQREILTHTSQRLLLQRLQV